MRVAANTIRKMREVLTAKLLHRMEGAMHMIYGQRKQSVFRNLPATIVEIGPGTGANWRYYRPGTRVIAVEPNTAMHPYLYKAARRYGLQIDIHGTKAERLDLESGSAEVVVGTLVLCSVDDPEKVLAEVRRILKPGGRFIFLEHVAAMAGTPLARVQNGLNRIWRRLFDSCRLNRHTWETINAAGFDRVAMDCFRLESSWMPVSPHIYGVAAN